MVLGIENAMFSANNATYCDRYATKEMFVGTKATVEETLISVRLQIYLIPRGLLLF